MGQREKLPQKQRQRGSWVQTERAAHEAWARLIGRAPRAAQLMHLLVGQLGDNNAVVISYPTLKKLMGVGSINTIKSAVKHLEAERWIEVRKTGPSGSTNAYVINSRVAWHGHRDGLRYALFSASVVVKSDDQPDQAELGNQPGLRQLPSVHRDEQQLPAGNGEPPPAEPPLEGMEPDLPARQREVESEDLAEAGGGGSPAVAPPERAISWPKAPPKAITQALRQEGWAFDQNRKIWRGGSVTDEIRGLVDEHGGELIDPVSGEVIDGQLDLADNTGDC